MLGPATSPSTPCAIYNKFITHRRSGYCMEHSLFFNYRLPGLGFTVWNAGARVPRHSTVFRQGITWARPTS
jgi:arylamine N-acetyltransferase